MRALPRLVLAALLAVAAAAPAAAREVPFLSGRVNDTAGIVPADVRARVEEKLAQLEKATGAQIAVLTIASLEGDPLEEYSLNVAHTWKLGRKGVDDGALLLVAKDDRKMRIEVGYGLEPKLTDIACKRILDDVVRPPFCAGDFGKGIESGVDAMIGTVQGKDVLPPAGSGAARGTPEPPLGARLAGSLVFLLVIGTFSFLAIFAKGCMSWFLYAFLLPFYAMFPAAFWGRAGFIVFPIWLLGFPIAKFVLAKTGVGKEFMKAHPGLATAMASSGGSGGGWSSGGSSGGFSGGGGSFGGGGSSSSW